MQVYHYREHPSVRAFQYHSTHLQQTINLLLSLTRGAYSSERLVSDLVVDIEEEGHGFVIYFSTTHAGKPKRLTLPEGWWIVLDHNDELSVLSDLVFQGVFTS